ncbi:hypothetical protein SZ66_19905 [Pantoea ananatis]|nr:hypothetical protein [Pantoea ananatis]
MFARLSPFAGAETSTNRLAVQGRLKPLAGKFFVGPKIFPLAPGQLHRPVLVTPFAANGSQTGEGYNLGRKQQFPAKRQDRGPGNSTGDGF